MTTRYIDLICPECGSPYSVPAGRSSEYRRKYCGDRCQFATSSREAKQVWEEWREETARRRASA